MACSARGVETGLAIEADEEVHVQLGARIVSGHGPLQSKLAHDQMKIMCDSEEGHDALAAVEEIQFARVHPRRDRKRRRILALYGLNLVQGFAQSSGQDFFDRTLMYALYLVQALASEAFVLVHVHDGMREVSSKYLTWLHRFYKLVPKAHLQNVARVLVLTSSRRLRSRMWLARPFTSSRLWKKIEYVHSTSKLVERLGCVLNVPETPPDIDIDTETLPALLDSPLTPPDISAALASGANMRDLFARADALSGPGSRARGGASGATTATDADNASARNRDKHGTRRSIAVERIRLADVADHGHQTSARTMHDSRSGSDSLDFTSSGLPSARTLEGIDISGAHSSSFASSRSASASTLTQTSPSSDKSRRAADELGSPGGASAVFGAALHTVACRSVTGIPIVVQDCVETILAHGADQEGIFRIPGDDNVVDFLKMQYNQGRRPASLEFGNAGSPKVALRTRGSPPGAATSRALPSVHALASLLKAYFRDLPEPVVPQALYMQVLQLAESISDMTTLAYQMGDRMISMPQANFDALGYLMHFLCHISIAWCPKSKMTIDNLTIVWAPNILSRGKRISSSATGPAYEHASNGDMLQTLADLPSSVKAVKCMIMHADIVFPHDMLATLPPVGAEASQK